MTLWLGIKQISGTSPVSLLSVLAGRWLKTDQCVFPATRPDCVSLIPSLSLKFNNFNQECLSGYLCTHFPGTQRSLKSPFYFQKFFLNYNFSFFIFPDLSSFILQTHWVQIFGILFTAFLLSNPLKWLVYFHLILCTSFSILSSTYPAEFVKASVICAASNMPFITSNSWIFLFHVFLHSANRSLISLSLTAPSLMSISALTSCFIQAIGPCLIF